MVPQKLENRSLFTIGQKLEHFKQSLTKFAFCTIYIEHNYFHQSKLGRDVELQNTHIVLFKSPRDVMQVTTPSPQLGLGSELVDWYQAATSVPFGHMVIDLSPRTDDRLPYCTNSGSVPSNFSIPECVKL